MNKAELYNLYVTLRSANLTPKSTAASKGPTKRAKLVRSRTRLAQLLLYPAQGPSFSSASSQRQAFSEPGPRPRAHHRKASLISRFCSTFHRGSPCRCAECSWPPSTSLSAPPATDNPFYFQWLPAPVTNASVRLPLLAAQATQQGISNPAPLLWPTVAETSTRLPPLATQAHTFHSFSHATNNPLSFQWPPAPVVNASVRLPPLARRKLLNLFRVSQTTPPSRGPE